mmetsp:Transcript_45355/g.105234  ORF Transcript_45355/g.105234 Transcript_45355/m.105234 type:complete len:228 (-) Transcript_45355:116-799(-)
MWVGGGDKYGFLNQPKAASNNFMSLVSAMAPLLEKDGLQQEALQIAKEFDGLAQRKLDEVWRRKLGLQEGSAKSGELFKGLEPLLRSSQADYTLFWRCLADAAACESTADVATLVAPLKRCFQAPLDKELQSKLAAWLQTWIAEIRADGRKAEEAAAVMRQASPKYIPREWMLARAYTAAGQGDMSVVHKLQNIFQDPYGEQPEAEKEYFRVAPPEARMKGGVSWMT